MAPTDQVVFTTCHMEEGIGDVRERCVQWHGEFASGRRHAAAPALRRRVWLGAIAALVATAAWLAASATASAFSANGSVEQVYVTGLAPGAQMSLLRSGGETVATQNADSLGGLLFRNVTPEAGYKVKLTESGEEAGPITVYTQAAAPWDPTIFNQSVPTSGYGYITTRDGTRLAMDIHLPGGSAHKVPDADRIRGVWLREPRGP